MMFRTVLPSRRIYAAFGLVTVLALGAAAFFFTRQAPVPVTGGANIVRAPAAGLPNANVAPSLGQAIDLGDGSLLMIRPDGAQVMAHNNPVSAQPQVSAETIPGATSLSFDLGAGYGLAADELGGWVTGPETRDHPASRIIDLGAGFQLDLSAGFRRIYSPAHPSASYIWKDIGAGYLLEMNSENVRSAAPVALLKKTAVVSQAQTVDLAAGYRLMLQPSGVWVVAPSENQAAPQALTTPARVIDVGNGYYLSLDPLNDRAVDSSSAAQGLPDTGRGPLYRLETNSKGARVVAPDRAVDPGYQTFNLGAGYRLLVTGIGGEIIPPAGAPTNDRRVDLGEGYTLVITGGYARVLLPAGPIRPEPHDPSVHTDYIGGGFWLVTGSDGNLIFQEATK